MMGGEWIVESPLTILVQPISPRPGATAEKHYGTDRLYIVYPRWENPSVTWEYGPSVALEEYLAD